MTLKKNLNSTTSAVLAEELSEAILEATTTTTKTTARKRIRPYTTHRRYRDRHAITADILQCLPAKKTLIMYSATLSFTQLQEFLKTMSDADLIRQKSQRDADDTGYSLPEYYITKKGEDYLRHIRVLEQMLNRQQ